MANINTRKLCKGFIKKGDTESFAELCRNYVPNNSDKGDPTLMGKLKTFLTKRNKSARLQAALNERARMGSNEVKTRMNRALKESQMTLNQTRKSLNAAKKVLESGGTTPENFQVVVNGQLLAQNAMKITENLRNNAKEKSENEGYSSFSKSYFKNLNTKAEELRVEASTLSSEMKKVHNEMSSLFEKQEEESFRQQRIRQKQERNDALGKKAKERQNYERRLSEKLEQAKMGKSITLTSNERNFANAKIKELQSTNKKTLLEKYQSLVKANNNSKNPPPSLPGSVEMGMPEVKAKPLSRGERVIKLLKSFETSKSKYTPFPRFGGGKTRKNKH